MSSALAREQSSFLGVLAGQPGSAAEAALFDPRGLQVYRANRAVLAERTLASTYPVVCQLIGIESFAPLARIFWQQHPPSCGDLGQWGAQWADFLAAAPQLAGEPFLAHVARVEWALHRAASAADGVLDAASFALLANADIHGTQPVGLALPPGTAIFSSAYPVVSIVNAHLTGQPNLGEAAEMLRLGKGEYALVWREGFRPTVCALSRAEFQLLVALEKGMSLETALGLATQAEPNFDFSAWLIQAVQTGLVLKACRYVGLV